MLELKHDFYSNGNCPDFTVVPSMDTLKLFSKFKIKTVNTDTGLIALYEDRDGIPSSEISGNVHFTFGLQLKNPNFTNFTDLVAKNSTADKYRYYTNLNASSFSNEIIPVYSNLINYEFSLDATESTNGSPVTVYVNIGSETISSTVESYDNSGGTYYYRVQLNLKNAASGIYEIFRQASPDVLLEKILVDSSLNSSQIFGIIDILKSNNTPKDYNVQFNSKEVQWKYFLVFKNGGTDTALNHFSLVDTKPSPIEFSLITSPDDLDIITINTIKQQHPKAKVRMYLQDPPLIAFSETSRKGIALKKDGVDILPNLPNPNPKASKTEIFVYVDN